MNNLAKAYQQSVDILGSLADNLITAGIIELSDHSYTVLNLLRGKRILLAEDNDLNAEIAIVLLPSLSILMS